MEPNSTLPTAPQFLLDSYQLTADPSAPISVFQGHDLAAPTLLASDASRPFVTLTFAQSLDARIAGAHGAQLALSGRESMVMTHWMRTMHDAILVGIGTALNDDPQLNSTCAVSGLMDARLTVCSAAPPAAPVAVPASVQPPRPVILDTQLRLVPSCKLLVNYRGGRGRRPWVVCARSDEQAWRERKAVLESAGARIVEARVDERTGQISIPGLLEMLRTLGIRSVMVEGGARVIRSFLAEARAPGEESGSGGAVDMVIVTVAPTLVGKDGVSYGSDLLAEQLPALQHIKTGLFGRDAVMVLKVL
ncbi:2,5-diamino-6-ribosylamino-4(3H)-pyrimidinone 5'-phosphate reductase [Grifola frondosa]|uniref:2,5-diamino-6-ribosylamino-4(3H)-pyrimidinone 5'-phosphate reductase n=1 Tax=Grifola frondosa TaxID=5627 RepID=A0A1C7MQ98_GRIFR|nr:2,5-diamino-6-ribosylamino-4(3H)-pyrimidinone 5'-phosphate reductase [Grifola frondosa]